jgi:pimeloyl-ACP methyl ester carboxylesterase
MTFALSPGTTKGSPGRFVHEEWPYQPKFKRVNGSRMHYIDEGAGNPVVLLHGNPAWGFLYRKFVKPLTAAGRRVIVPDMIGLARERRSCSPRIVSGITRNFESSSCGALHSMPTVYRGLATSALRPE